MSVNNNSGCFDIGSVLGSLEADILKDAEDINDIFAEGKRCVLSQDKLSGPNSISDPISELTSVGNEELENLTNILSDFPSKHLLNEDSVLLTIKNSFYKAMYENALNGRNADLGRIKLYFNVEKELDAALKYLDLEEKKDVVYLKYRINFSGPEKYDRYTKLTLCKEIQTYIASNRYEIKSYIIDLVSSTKCNQESVMISANINQNVKVIHELLLDLNNKEKERTIVQNNANSMIVLEKKAKTDFLKCKNKLTKNFNESKKKAERLACLESVCNIHEVEKKSCFAEIRAVKDCKMIIANTILSSLRNIKSDINELIRNWLNDNLQLIKNKCNEGSFYHDNIEEKFSDFKFDLYYVRDISNALQYWIEDEDEEDEDNEGEYEDELQNK
jgi:hypothetical protein